ncbi:MAG TPA: hypothetical protein VF268_12080, partial [Gammaproteobacteria bacterium]
MVTPVLKHNTKWLAPSPLWQRDLTDPQQRQRFNRPAILRFKNDTFMDELLALMSYYPDRLGEWEAVPETWREPMAEPATAKKLVVPEPVSFFSAQQKRDIARLNKNIGQAGQSQSSSEGLLKLYQPSQQRFYLVTASLVCRKAGLPDRGISPNKLERPAFVVRRITPNDDETAEQLANGEIKVVQGRIQNCTEYAHVGVDSGYQWRDVGDLHPDQLAAAEERLPMFTVGFSDLNGYNRKLLSGLIPVGRREAYLNARTFVETPAGDDAEQEQQNAEKREAVKTLFAQQIAAPWKSLHTLTNNDRANLAGGSNATNRSLSAIEDDMGSPPSGGNNRTVLISREQVQTASWYVLIDLAGFLEKYLNNLWLLIKNNTFSPTALATLTSAERAVFDVLNSVRIGNDITTGPVANRRFLRAELATTNYTNDIEDNLLAVLHRVIVSPDIADNLEAVEELYSSEKAHAAGDPHSLWPQFLFPLADILYPSQIELTVTLPPGTDTSDLAAYEIEHLKIDQLAELITAAIPLDENTAIPEVQARPNSSSLSARDAWFVIRCVYETPNCGPFHPTLLSDPTRPFEMASFFDPDAPGRPVRIPMPMDISPAGLRKYSRNASFMISDALCGKIKGIRKITLGDLVLSVLPW